MAGEHALYVAHLRFVARTTARVAPEVEAMMAALDDIAGQVEEKGGAYTVPAGRLRVSARALAGVAGFLQQHILPEAVAAGNVAAEAQVRWVIDTSMEAVAALTVHAEQTGDGEPFRVILPPPPGTSGATPEEA